MQSLSDVRSGLEEIKRMLIPEVADIVVKGIATKVSAYIVGSTIEGCKFTRSGK